MESLHPRDRRLHLPGLPGERTLLAWDRTALALLANAALLILRDAGDTHPMNLAAAALATALAAMCGVLARVRARALSLRSDGQPFAAATAPVALVAAGTVALATLQTLAILLT